MAYTEFYVQSTGSNVNAGSTTADAAAVSVANASWDVTADTYIGLTGVEFAAVNVGDWASIYLDAATVAVYVAQVTVVGALGVSITLSTTAKYGTKPAAGATGRSCKVGGAHASELPWASAGLGGTTVPASTRVNWKQATYTVVAARTFSMVGTTTAPLWHRGYNTTPGDCDGDPTLAKPVLAFNATFLCSFNGAHHIWSSFSITGNRSGAVVAQAGASFFGLRLRVENTSSNAAAHAFSLGTNTGSLAYCWCKAPTTGTTNATLLAAGSASLVGCVSEGGGKAGLQLTGNGVAYQCIGLNNTGDALLLTSIGTGGVFAFTAYNPTGAGIKIPTASVGAFGIVGCLLSNCGTYGINQSSGTNTNTIFRACNDFYLCTSGNENGFGDSPAFFGQNESSSPFVSSTDMSLVAGALAHATGFAPGTFENASYRSTVAAGAVHTDAAVAGGGLLRHPGMDGGLNA